MNEFNESNLEQEVTEEDFQRRVLDQFEEIWLQHAWQCQKEISFTDQPLKSGGPAHVQKRPNNLNDPEENYQTGSKYMDNSIFTGFFGKSGGGGKKTKHRRHKKCKNSRRK